jgi:DNA-binding CsgD family transcriptional regulator
VLPGRAAEIARIDRLLDGARTGLSAALIVHGEPGIGKTTLLDAAVSAAAGFTVLRARPLQTESELPFAGLSDLLRPLLPLLDRIPARQSAVLSGALALGPPTPGDRFAAAAATISLLAAGAEERPVLAVVDDAHWLDTPSREALLFAGRRLGGEGVVLLLAMRDRPWLASAGIERLELRGLPPDAAAELASRAGRTVSAGIRDRLVVETGGNPLALLEVLATLTDAQLDGSAPIVEPIAAGSTLEWSFAQRLEPLPKETRRALLVAATSYTGEASEIGRALANLGLETSAFEAAERQGLVTLHAGRVDFLHPLLRAAVYHVADAVERRSAHRALAKVLDQSQQDRIAWHLAAATTGPDEEVARYLEETAVTAQGRRGYATAANALATAARLSPGTGDRIRRTIGAANAFRLGGQAQTAADLLAGVLDLATDPLLRADIQQLRGLALMSTGPIMEAFAMLVDEADRVEGHNPARATTLLTIASLGAVGAAEVKVAVETARRAVRTSMSVDGPEAMLAALSLSFGLTLAGGVSEARSILEPLIPLLETLDPLGEAGLVIGMAAHMLEWIEDWGTARRMLEHVVRTARAASAVTMLPHPLASISELEVRCGRMAPALAAATESVQIAAETGQAVDSSIALVALARAEAVLGLESECRGHVAAALDVAGPVGMTAIENYAASVLGVLELSLGHPERAVAPLEECARLEIEYGVGLPTAVQWNADLIEAYVRVGRAGDAIRELEKLEHQGRETGSRWAAATAARCRGLLADDDAYDAILLHALELHGEDEPLERARTELCLGRRRRHSRHRAAARVVLHQALTTFEGLGAEPWAEQARVELRATGEAPAASRGGSLTALTSQELQVALVVAGGATNKEAGAALFIGPKTVEFHLGHVYGKLGVRSRSELVRRVAGLS